MPLKVWATTLQSVSQRASPEGFARLVDAICPCVAFPDAEVWKPYLEILTSLTPLVRLLRTKS